MLFMALCFSTALAEPGTVAIPANVGDVTTHRYHSIEKMRDDVYHITDDVIKPLGGIEGYNPSNMYLVIGTERVYFGILPRRCITSANISGRGVAPFMFAAVMWRFTIMLRLSTAMELNTSMNPCCNAVGSMQHGVVICVI